MNSPLAKFVITQAAEEPNISTRERRSEKNAILMNIVIITGQSYFYLL